MSALIIDFDGVLVNSMLPMVNYICQTFKISKNSALKKIFSYSLRNRHSWISNSLKDYHAKNFLKFLERIDQNYALINQEMFAVLNQIDCPKAILTTNYSFVCRQILGEKESIFQQIIGFDTSRTKTRGLEFLFSLPQFPKENTLLITDTVGDILEFQNTLPNNQILASSWGFNSRPILENLLPVNQVLQNPKNLLEFIS